MDGKSQVEGAAIAEEDVQVTETSDMWVTSFRPNGLQAAADGLWVIAQSNGGETDQHIYKLRYEDGALVSKVHTDAVHASGVTEGGGHLWATGGYDLLRLNYDGSTSETFLAPGGPGGARRGMGRRSQHVGHRSRGLQSPPRRPWEHGVEAFQSHCQDP